MSYQVVAKWQRAFLDGRENVFDEARCGRSSLVKIDQNIVAVRNVIEKDRRFSIDEILHHLPPGIESVFKILTEELNFTKVCARWVPRLLTTAHREKRLDAAKFLFQLRKEEGDELFSRIVTTDETWVHHCTPETKEQSKVWKTRDETAPKKAKVTLSAGKIMATVFWDAQGILLIDFLERGKTIDAARYCEVLKKLKSAIKRKRPGLLSSQVLVSSRQR